jgi:hypothetical protein
MPFILYKNAAFSVLFYPAVLYEPWRSYHIKIFLRNFNANAGTNVFLNKFGT